MPLPSDYQELSYLESTGTQYIDTGVYLANPYYVELRCAIDPSRADTQCVYGSLPDTDAQRFFGGLVQYNLYNRLGSAIVQKAGDSDYHTFKTEPNLAWIDSTSSGGYTATAVQGNLFLFRGSDSTRWISSYAKLKYCVVLNGNQSVVRHFIPALRRSDSKPGLYDQVTGNFYVNQGSGEFLYAIESNSAIRVKVNGSWKTGTPYIKVNGQWKKGTAYIKTNGSWKKGV